MGKEFIEYYNEERCIPYSLSDICFCLTQYVKDYISSECNFISYIDIEIRDRALVNSINYLGLSGGYDYGLEIEDLYDDIIWDEYVDPNCLLTVLLNHYSYYVFSKSKEFFLRDEFYNFDVNQFKVSDADAILLDFINYVFKQNNFDRCFTINDLYKRYQHIRYKKDMNELKLFLELSGIYSEKLQNGEDIDNIFFELVIKTNNVKYISSKNLCDYIFTKNKINAKDKERFDRGVYALAYAYEKMSDNYKYDTKTDIIKAKIKEMRR